MIWKDTLIKHAVRPLLFGIQKTPLPVLRWSGRCLGKAVYGVSGKRRRIALENLRSAFGDSKTETELRCIARGSFCNLLTLGLEFLHSPAMRIPICDFYDCRNLQNYLDAHATGQGVIVLVPHMGNWEVIARYFSEQGHVAHAVARHQKQKWVDQLVAEIRKCNGLNVIYKQNALRQVLGALRRGETVCMLIDQHASKEAVLTTFFDRPAMTVGSAALLALKTNCKVIVFATYRKDDGTVGSDCSLPIEYEPTGDLQQDIQALTQKYVEVLEGYVRQHPHSWMWMHRRWREPEELEKLIEQV